MTLPNRFRRTQPNFVPTVEWEPTDTRFDIQEFIPKSGKMIECPCCGEMVDETALEHCMALP